jgi:two-component system nitrate/nitrite response regulator NarL
LSVRVVVVSDDALVRGGLAALVADDPAIVLVGQWTPAAVTHDEAEVAVWDAEGPASFDLMADAQARGVAVLAVLRDAAQAAVAASARVRGVVARDVAAPRLVAAVHAVAEGLMVLDGAAAEALLVRRGETEPLLEPLTAREQEVLQLVAEGLSNKLIAARLGISEHTAKFHVNSILGKLGAQTRAEAVATAARMGLLLL